MKVQKVPKLQGSEVPSKLEVKLPEGSEVPSKGSKYRMHEVQRFQAKGFK